MITVIISWAYLFCFSIQLTQEYEEILEENAALKRELLRLDEINKEKELNEVNLT